MKILLASSSSGSRGGGELYLLYLGRALAQRGHAVPLWASAHPRMDELANSFSVHRRSDALALSQHLRPARPLALQLLRIFAPPAASPANGASAARHPAREQAEPRGWPRPAPRRAPSRICRMSARSTSRKAREYLKAQACPRARLRRPARALRNYRGPLVTVLETPAARSARIPRRRRAVRMIPNGVPLFDLSRRETSAREPSARSSASAATNCSSSPSAGWCRKSARCSFSTTPKRVHRALPQARFLWVGEGALSGAWDAGVRARGLGR